MFITVTAYLLVYVDDFLLTGNDNAFVARLIEQLAKRFSIKELGSLSYFLGVEVLSWPGSLFLSQRKYIVDLLARHNMLTSKPTNTPLAVGTSLSLHDGSPPADSTVYRLVAFNIFS